MMCGIFGTVAQQKMSPDHFRQLAALNKQRGNLGFGWLWLEGGNELVHRYAQPFTPALVPAETSHVFLGHIRAPTGKRSTRTADVHPFAAAAGWLAHNGLLLNDAHFPSWRLDPAVTVDSQIILGGIQLYLDHGRALPQAIQQTVAQLEGQQACWFWSKPERHLYLWRVMAPIYTGLEAGVFYFSSMKSERTQTLLPEGVIYRLQPDTLTLAAVETFAFYSPYHLG